MRAAVPTVCHATLDGSLVQSSKSSVPRDVITDASRDRNRVEEERSCLDEYSAFPKEGHLMPLLSGETYPV